MKFILLLFTMLVSSLISNNLLADSHLPLPAQYPLEKILITVSSQSNNTKSYQILLNGKECYVKARS